MPDSDTQPDPYIDQMAAEHVQEYEPQDNCEGEGNWPVQREGEHPDDYNVRMEEAMFGPQDADLDEEE